MGLIHKEYYSANATYLSDENIKEIKTSKGTVVDAVNEMAKKFHISHARVLDYMDNRERKQQVIKPLVSTNAPENNTHLILKKSISSRESEAGGGKKKRLKTKARSSKVSPDISEPACWDVDITKLSASVIKEMENNVAVNNRILAMDESYFLD